MSFRFYYFIFFLKRLNYKKVSEDHFDPSSKFMVPLTCKFRDKKRFFKSRRRDEPSVRRRTIVDEPSVRCYFMPYGYYMLLLGCQVLMILVSIRFQQVSQYFCLDIEGSAIIKSGTPGNSAFQILLHFP